MKAIAALCLSLQLSLAMGAQARKSAAPQVVVLPRGPITRIASPDRKWTLIFECPNVCSQRKLSIEKNAAHARRLVKEYERSLDVGWAPDSHSFFVNDASGSTDTRAYVYHPATLKETVLETVLLAGDRSADKYLGAGHCYLEVKRWITSHELLVALWGQFDNERRGFTLKYRLDLNGGVHRLYKHEY